MEVVERLAGVEVVVVVVVVVVVSHETGSWRRPTLEQLPNRLGRQLEQSFPAFTQAHPLHWPVLLQRQHTTILSRPLSSLPPSNELIVLPEWQ